MKNNLAYTVLLSGWMLLGISSDLICFAAELNPDAGALEIDTDSSLARWHNGQVHFDGQWRSIEEVQQLVSSDPRWQEYRQRVDASDDNLESHVKLARWCQRNGLSHEEKLHWLYVLQADPNHRGALKGLGLIYYQGQLCPIDQVALRKQQAEAAKQALNRYKPSFLILRRSAQSGSETEREAAFAELAAVTDPAAIPSLAEIARLEFGNVDSPPNRSESAKKKPFEVKLQKTVITALSNIEEHESTQKLLEIALLSPYPEIRHIAAAELIPREKTSYMPFLMAKLAYPLEAQFDLSISPSGVVRLTERVANIGPEAEWHSTRNNKYLTKSHTVIDREETGTREERVVINPERDRIKAIRRAQQTQRNVAEINRWRTQWNERIKEVLEITTNDNYGDNPENWWSYWKEYNELDYSKDRPVYSQVENEQYINYSSSYRFIAKYRPRPPGSISCFAAGTPVWTQSGPVPIESIKIGDLVLSQDPITGCLDYRPVLNTTVRAPSPTMQLDLNDETIVATRGHRFWVIGNGWRMAKHLSAGDPLHGSDSAADLVSVSEGEKVGAYNLVVGDFHTYFVGNCRLLVHDNGCPRPSTAVAPGVEPAVHAAR